MGNQKDTMPGREIIANDGMATPLEKTCSFSGEIIGDGSLSFVEFTADFFSVVNGYEAAEKFSVRRRHVCELYTNAVS